MPVEVSLQVVTSLPSIPTLSQFQHWAGCVLPKQHAQVCLRLVDQHEMQALNAQYRHRDRPTNVLSFPCDVSPEYTNGHLGDIVICAPVVEEEAQVQHKTTEGHWAHLFIHGLLHLLGYDHVKEADAVVMETLETTLLLQLGYSDPYQMENNA